jgi:hypothetical protein
MTLLWLLEKKEEVKETEIKSHKRSSRPRQKNRAVIPPTLSLHLAAYKVKYFNDSSTFLITQQVNIACLSDRSDMGW